MNPPNHFSTMGFHPLPITGGALQPPFDSPAVTWTNPRNAQAQSLLIQLPAEIRSMILRELLEADHPISERTQQPGQVPYTYDAAGRARDQRGRFIRDVGAPLAIGHGLTPTILRTCQSLLADGRSDLYDRNVLQVDFAIGNYPGPLLTQEGICSAGIRGCQECVLVTTFDDEPLQQRDHRGVWHYDQNIQRIVSRFRKLLFTMRVADDHSAYENARHLLSYWAQTPGFAQKEVQVEIVSPPGYVPGRAHTNLLGLFRLLRCASFKFLHEATLDPMHRGVAREVVSTLPVLRFDQAWEISISIMAHLTLELRRRNHQAGLNQLRNYSDVLLRARAEFRPAQFLRGFAQLTTMHAQLVAQMQREAQQSATAFHNNITARDQESARIGTTMQDYQ